jgi:hypothetical protein
LLHVPFSAPEWEELELASTAVRGVYSPLFGEVFHVMAHSYHIFEPGMDPGTYEWEWKVAAPWIGDGLPVVAGGGVVEIVDA